jgi:hypothetical protein
MSRPYSGTAAASPMLDLPSMPGLAGESGSKAETR